MEILNEIWFFVKYLVFFLFIIIGFYVAQCSLYILKNNRPINTKIQNDDEKRILSQFLIYAVFMALGLFGLVNIFK